MKMSSQTHSPGVLASDFSFLDQLNSESGKTFKKGLYNGVAFVLIMICGVAVWGLFTILQPFLKPLLWAMLCGSALHPFKRGLAAKLKKCIVDIENSPKPFFVAVVSVPLGSVLDLYEFVKHLVHKHLLVLWSIIGIFWGLCASQICLTVFHTSTSILDFFYSSIISTYESTTVMVALVAMYISLLYLVQSPSQSALFTILSPNMLFALTIYFASFFPALKYTIIIAFVALYAVGLLLPSDRSEITGPDESLLQEFESGEAKATFLLTEEKEKEPINKNQECLSQSTKSSSDWYFQIVGLGCVAVLIAKFWWLTYFTFLLVVVSTVYTCDLADLAQLLPISTISSTIKQSAGIFYDTVKGQGQRIKKWLEERNSVVYPRPLPALYQIWQSCKTKLLARLEKSSDSAAAVIVIVGLLFGSIIGSIFFSIQAYTEGFYMLASCSSVVNQTIVHNPQLRKMLPADIETKIDLALNSAYTYGREYIATTIRALVSNGSNTTGNELEQSAVELWDRIYQAWMMAPLEKNILEHGPVVDADAVAQSWWYFQTSLNRTSPYGLLSWSSVKNLVTDNMAIVTSALESMKEHTALVLSLFYSLVAYIFGGGYVLLNFILNLVVFLTALFYLLSSSRDLYKPVKIITMYSPHYGKKFAMSLETAVNQVLAVSFKAALFYTMWTWLIHSMGHGNIVYIPAATAGMLAVVPVLGTYWACLPAVLDLWLAQDKSIDALLLLTAQFLPTLFVDASIYNEIQGCHPYVTGLSVGGGIFCLGMEGAIIGPLILCILLAVINLWSAVVNE